jgi:hypothetical protein
MRNPHAHVLNSSGTACEDGTSCAGATPCPACRWAATYEPDCCQFHRTGGKLTLSCGDDNAPDESTEEDSADDWETPCPMREDGIHCNCWYDGSVCCSCGAPGTTEGPL